MPVLQQMSDMFEKKILHIITKLETVLLKMSNKLNVSCSPGTYHRVKNDEAYRRDVTSHVLAQEENQYEEVIYSQTNAQTIEEVVEATSENVTTPSDTVTVATARAVGIETAATVAAESCADIDAIFTPLSDLDEEKQYWSEGAIKFMLASIENLHPKVGKSISVKTKSKMYGIVSERMAEKNYVFTPTQIENKFRGMERQYKKTVLNNRQTGRNRQTCPFEKELAQVLGKKKGINPEFVLDSGDVEGQGPNKSFDEDFSSDLEQVLPDDTPSCSRQAPKKRKVGPTHDLLDKIDQMMEEKRDFHSKVLEHMRKKDERAEKKEQRSQQKLELLQQLVNKKK